MMLVVTSQNPGQTMTEKTFQAITISSRGDVKATRIENTLEAQQSIVGGYIEVLNIPNSSVKMIVNEEGILLKLPLNRIASVLVGHPIFGDAFITRFNADGDNIDMTLEDIYTISYSLGMHII